MVPSKALSGFGLHYLAEVFVEGRELTVGVVDDVSGPTALPVSEVRLIPGGAFDYAGKYLGKGTEEITPAQVPTGGRRPDSNSAPSYGSPPKKGPLPRQHSHPSRSLPHEVLG